MPLTKEQQQELQQKMDEQFGIMDETAKATKGDSKAAEQAAMEGRYLGSLLSSLPNADNLSESMEGMIRQGLAAMIISSKIKNDRAAGDSYFEDALGQKGAYDEIKNNFVNSKAMDELMDNILTDPTNNIPTMFENFETIMGTMGEACMGEMNAKEKTVEKKVEEPKAEAKVEEKMTEMKTINPNAPEPKTNEFTLQEFLGEDYKNVETKEERKQRIKEEKEFAKRDADRHKAAEKLRKQELKEEAKRKEAEKKDYDKREKEYVDDATADLKDKKKKADFEKDLDISNKSDYVEAPPFWKRLVHALTFGALFSKECDAFYAAAAERRAKVNAMKFEKELMDIPLDNEIEEATKKAKEEFKEKEKAAKDPEKKEEEPKLEEKKEEPKPEEKKEEEPKPEEKKEEEPKLEEKKEEEPKLEEKKEEPKPEEKTEDPNVIKSDDQVKKDTVVTSVQNDVTSKQEKEIEKKEEVITQKEEAIDAKAPETTEKEVQEQKEPEKKEETVEKKKNIPSPKETRAKSKQTMEELSNMSKDMRENNKTKLSKDQQELARHKMAELLYDKAMLNLTEKYDGPFANVGRDLYNRGMKPEVREQKIEEMLKNPKLDNILNPSKANLEKLEKAGTGMDSSLFNDFKTVQETTKKAEENALSMNNLSFEQQQALQQKKQEGKSI